MKSVSSEWGGGGMQIGIIGYLRNQKRKEVVISYNWLERFVYAEL